MNSRQIRFFVRLSTSPPCGGTDSVFMIQTPPINARELAQPAIEPLGQVIRARHGYRHGHSISGLCSSLSGLSTRNESLLLLFCNRPNTDTGKNVKGILQTP
jgi:hypothetical protein